jgi:hypothetical protein
MGATKRRTRLNGRRPVCNKIPRANRSTPKNIHAQNFARRTLGHDLERTAAHLAIRREALAGHARVDRRRKRLAAERALDGREFFHAANLTARGQSAIRLWTKICDRK